MDRRVVDVCQAGNIEAFYALLEDYPSILNYIDEVPFTRTPLHLAILAENYDFAKIIASLKPSFITKIDSFGYSPIHLAAKSGHVEMVRSLMQMLQPNGVQFVRGKDSITPLHIAVISGKIEVVKYLVDSYPECILGLTAQNETALHLAVKNKQVEVFCYLVEWLKLAEQSSKTKAVHAPFDYGEQVIVELGSMSDLVNWKDMDGNNILHLTTMTNQYKMSETLLSNDSSVSNGIIQVDVSSTNARSKYTYRHAGDITPCLINSSFPSHNAFEIQTNPSLNDDQITSSLLSKINIVIAIIMVTICMATTTTNINFYPFIIFNMIGFCLSFYTLLVASTHSTQRKALVIILMFVFIAYIYVTFTSVRNNDRAFVGGVFLAILGAGIAMVHVNMRWFFCKKHCVQGMKTPLCYQRNPSLSSYSVCC